MPGEFNKIPAQCVECPLQQQYVDNNDVVLTRNCAGPSFEAGSFTGSTTVRGGEVVQIDAEKRGTSEVACRNAGLIAWKAARELEYLEAQQA